MPLACTLSSFDKGRCTRYLLPQASPPLSVHFPSSPMRPSSLKVNVPVLRNENLWILYH